MFVKLLKQCRKITPAVLVLITLYLLSNVISNVNYDVSGVCDSEASSDSAVVPTRYRPRNPVVARQAREDDSLVLTPGSQVSTSGHFEEDTTLIEYKPRWRTFHEALSDQSNSWDLRRLVFLALVDEGFLDMALNFHETSLKRHKIVKYIFIGLTNRTCHVLQDEGLACFVYRQMSSGNHSSRYHSPAFLDKMNIRTDMILEALRLGYTIIHTDVDMIYFKHPLPYISCNGRCDLAALVDGTSYNAGFIFLRPTNHSIQVYEKMQKIARTKPQLDDQVQLQQAIRHTSASSPRSFKPLKLDRTMFQNGNTYFEKGERVFADDSTAPCAKCVVIHNNWIVSHAAKVYRFKELHLWMYDANGYYTDPDRTYLVYENPLVGRPSRQDAAERDALVNALGIGQILNRTVILPRFHCTKNGALQDCALNSKYRLEAFDNCLGNNYRESTFLVHPKVPDTTKSGQSGLLLIRTSEETKISHHPSSVADYRPNSTTGATSEEILEWFGAMTDKVLRFTSLYGAFSSFVHESEEIEFRSKVRSALVPGQYRQM